MEAPGRRVSTDSFSSRVLMPRKAVRRAGSLRGASSTVFARMNEVLRSSRRTKSVCESKVNAACEVDSDYEFCEDSEQMSTSSDAVIEAIHNTVDNFLFVPQPSSS